MGVFLGHLDLGTEMKILGAAIMFGVTLTIPVSGYWAVDTVGYPLRKQFRVTLRKFLGVMVLIAIWGFTALTFFEVVHRAGIPVVPAG